MTLDDFLPYILPAAKGCPDVVARLSIRMAIIELCTKALIWRETQSNVTTVADQTAYAYSPAAGQQIVKLLSLTLDGQGVEVVDPRIGRARDLAGDSDTYAYGKFSGFELRPAQAAGMVISTYCVVAPSVATLAIPDEFSRYTEQIAHGCLSRLLADKGREYHDSAGAVRAQAMWDSAIAKAKRDGFDGNARVTQRTAKVWF